MAQKEEKMVVVVGVKVKQGKPQHLEIGKEYTMTESNSKLVIKNGQAKAKSSK